MRTTLTITDPAHARVVLADQRFAVPPLAPEATAGLIGWLRTHVGRFSTGEAHARRRGYAVTTLAAIDPAALRRRAADLAAASVDPPRVPVAVLAEALGVAAADVPTVVDAVATVAGGYFPGTDAGQAGEDAVAYLIKIFGGIADERTAARIGLLVQACDATAGLVTNALRRPHHTASTEELLDATLREDPPVRVLRRVCVAPSRIGGVDVGPGTTVMLDVAAATDDVGGDHLAFGGGDRRCPGRDHALALAAGVIGELAA